MIIFKETRPLNGQENNIPNTVYLWKQQKDILPL